MEAEQQHKGSTDWIEAFLLCAILGAVTYALWLMRTSVYDLEARTAALEAAWGRREVPVPEETPSEEK
jgi:hypothetical protein